MLTISVLIIFISATGVAQVVKGDLLLGGSMGFVNSNSSYINGSGSSSNVNFNPRISLGVGNNSILGARLGYIYSNNKLDGSPTKINSNSFSVGLFWRKLIPIKGRFGWYPELGGNFIAGKINNVDYNGIEVTSKTSGYTIFVAPGLYYSIAPKFLLNVDFGGASYNHAKVENSPGSDSKGNNFQFGLFQNFNFGFDFILGGKKK